MFLIKIGSFYLMDNLPVFSKNNNDSIIFDRIINLFTYIKNRRSIFCLCYNMIINITISILARIK